MLILKRFLGAVIHSESQSQDLRRAALSRRRALGLAFAAGALPLALMSIARAAPVTRFDVSKSPGCQCCEGWVAHMRAAGFDVMVHEVDDMQAMKLANGVPDSLQSCHTTLADGYVIEGHVPADDVRRLLAERPAAKGLAVPGMEPSSPGMDSPGTPYKVVLFGGAGGDRTWAQH